MSKPRLVSQSYRQYTLIRIGKWSLILKHHIYEEFSHE